MIKSRKVQLVMLLILVYTYSLGISAEPNETKTEIKFDIRQSKPRTGFPRQNTLPNDTTHYAVLLVRGNWSTFRERIPIEEILEISDGQSMSQKQCDTISNRAINFMDYESKISNYTYFQLYGVSEDDVKKMVKAFIKIIENRIESDKLRLMTLKKECQTKLTEMQKQLSEKQELQKKAEKDFENVKNNTHYLSPEEAKKTVEKLNTILDNLNIEISGMKIKLETIDREHAAAKDRMKSFEQQEIYQNSIWPKLELMRIDQIIDLRVAEEKRKIASRIRQEAEQFYTLHQQKYEKELELIGLKRRLSDCQGQLDSINRSLSTEPKLQPLKIFQNKVTIYPVQ
jgi:hypothetical protein